MLFASLSKLQDKDEQFKNAYIKSLQMISFVTFPLMTIIAVSADVFIPSLLGEKWLPSVPLIPLFSMIGLVHSLHSAMPAVFQARGETALFLRMVIYVFIGNAIAFTVGLRWGILGVASAYLTINLLLTPVLISSVLRIIEMNWSHLFKALSPAIISTLVLIIFWIIAGEGLNYFVIWYNPLMILIFQIFISGIIYLLVSWRINPIVKETLLRLRKIAV